MAGYVDGVDDFVVAGYTSCVDCGEWFVDGSQGNHGYCARCAIARVSREHQDRLAYEFEGRTYSTREKPRRKAAATRSQRPPMTPEAVIAKRKWQRAKSRAMHRLCLIYAPMFDVLMAEEKARVGLDPYLHKNRPRPVAVTQAILEDLAEAAERDSARLRERA